MALPSQRRPSRSGQSRNSRDGATGLARAFLDRLAPHGPVAVLVFAYFMMLGALGYFASKQTFSENITIALGAFGLAALGGFIRHVQRSEKTDLEKAMVALERERLTGQEQRKTHRGRLPPPPPPQLPLDLE